MAKFRLCLQKNQRNKKLLPDDTQDEPLRLRSKDIRKTKYKEEKHMPMSRPKKDQMRGKSQKKKANA